MQVLDEFIDEEFTLIGIHTALEEYRLAFFLNKFLNFRLKRTNDLKVKKRKKILASFSRYDFENDESYYNLITNICMISTDSVGLFNESELSIRLVSEQKRVDFFLKVEGEFSQKIISKINNIPEIITAYFIEPNSLKSKDFLIF